MARRYRKCVVEGCERRSQLGQLVCADHERTELGVATSRQVVKLEREIKSLALANSEEERRLAAKRFQQRVERGDFAAIFAGGFRELIERGAEQGLEHMAGALQIAVVRLLMEERDPAKMATALAKVAQAYANVKRTEDRLMQNDYYGDDYDDYEPRSSGYDSAGSLSEEREGTPTAVFDMPIEAAWRERQEAVTSVPLGGRDSFRDREPLSDENMPLSDPAAGAEQVATHETDVAEEMTDGERRRMQMRWRDERLRKAMWDAVLDEGKPRKG